MNWKWNTEPLGWKDRCSVCQQPLRVQGDGSKAQVEGAGDQDAAGYDVAGLRAVMLGLITGPRW